MRLTPTDEVLNELPFRPYRSIVERRFERFLPAAGEPQEIDVITPWGESLTAKAGDYLVSETDAPEDTWPVDAEIFESTYLITGPGRCVKRAITLLVPLVELTGDPDRLVTIETMEGEETVRAGDFYLARGVKGELWAYPKEKVGKVMVPAE
ncbi:MAG: hypothetical protein ABWK53_00665 [Anaerolineales bacterium]